jgi:hypothetical protein
MPRSKPLDRLGVGYDPNRISNSRKVATCLPRCAVAACPRHRRSAARRHCLAAQVYDHAGHVALVITVMGPAGTFDASWNRPIAKEQRRGMATINECRYRWLRLPDLNLLLSQRFGSIAPAPRRKVCQSQKYPLCFNGRIGIGKTGKPIEIGEFSPFPRERHVGLLCNLESARQFLRASSPNT